MRDHEPEYSISNLVTRGSLSGRITRNPQQLNIPCLKTQQDRKLFTMEEYLFEIS